MRKLQVVIRGRDGFVVEYVELPEPLDVDIERKLKPDVNTKVSDYDYDTNLFAMHTKDNPR